MFQTTNQMKYNEIYIELSIALVGLHLQHAFDPFGVPATWPGDCRTGFSSFRMFCKPPVRPSLVIGDIGEWRNVENGTVQAVQESGIGEILVCYFTGDNEAWINFEPLGIGGGLLSKKTSMFHRKIICKVWIFRVCRGRVGNHISLVIHAVGSVWNCGNLHIVIFRQGIYGPNSLQRWVQKWENECLACTKMKCWFPSAARKRPIFFQTQSCPSFSRTLPFRLLRHNATFTSRPTPLTGVDT